MKNSVRAIPLFAMLLLSYPSYAIINIESMRVVDAEPGHHGNVNLYLDGRNGTSDRLTYGLGAHVTSRFIDREVIYMFDRQFGTANGQTNTDQRFFHLRYHRMTSDTDGYEIFTQYEQDQFRAIISRTLVGSNYRLRPKSDDNSEAVNIYGIGAFYEEEEILDQGSEVFQNTVRGNFYWTYKTPLSENAFLSNSLYYQPNVKKFSDQKGLWQFGVSVAVTKSVALTVSINANYDTDTPENVDALEASYFTSLKYDF